MPGKPTIVEFDVEMKTPGASLWSFELVPANDHFPINNQASSTVNVRGRPHVLLLHEKPQQLRSFSRLCASKQSRPKSVANMAYLKRSKSWQLRCPCACGPTGHFATPREMQMIKRYVMDLGAGGLLRRARRNSFAGWVLQNARGRCAAVDFAV